MRLLTALVALTLVLMVAASGAQQVPQSSQRVALVIGNSAYTGARSLRNPPNDARLVAGALKNAGFQVVDVQDNASLATFRQALRDFRNKANRAQVALIYYAGHGIEGNGKNWLIPTDAVLATERDLDYEAISLDLVLDAVKGADLRVVVLDACRNNPFGRSWGDGARDVKLGLAGIDVDDVLVIYAAAPGQTASDGPGVNSPFATAFARRVPEAGVPIQMLGGMVRDDVLVATGRVQRPFISASITGKAFYLVDKPATALTTTPTAMANPCADADERWISGLKASSDRAALQGFIAAAPGQCISRDAAQLKLASLPVRVASAAGTMMRSWPAGSFRDCADCPQMVTVPGGAATLGSTARADEQPVHQAQIAGFAVGAYEVTFAEWDACVVDGGCDHYQPDDAGWGRGARPAIYVSWNDAKKYLAWLKQKTGKDYRLLSEAEWEYAARAGTQTTFFTGASIGASQANFNRGSGGTREVGGYAPNAWGLFDTGGNVYEWLEDCYHDTYAGAPADGAAVTAAPCQYRVVRGGAWYDNARGFRSSNRGRQAPTARTSGHGFRVALTL